MAYRYYNKNDLGTYLKKRELAKQTCRVFKVSVVGLRNERRIMGDEVR